MIKLLLPLALAFSLSAHADEDDCTMEFSSVKTALSPDAKLFRSLGKPEVDTKKRTLTHKATLKNGTKLVYSEGGCHHHTFEFLFEGVKTSDMKDAFAKAEKLLLETPAVNDSFNKKELLKALAEGRKKFKEEPKGMAELPCGEFTTCTLNRNDGALQVSYNFAM